MKKLIITISVILLILLILFVPLPISLNDGGTTVWSATTYKIAKWHRLDSSYDSGYYENTSVYWFPDNFKSIDELWEMEQQND